MTRRTQDPYSAVQKELDAALAAADPSVVARHCRRAQLTLARIATSPSYDWRRHRSIAASLREVARLSRPDPSLPPLITRGVR